MIPVSLNDIALLLSSVIDVYTPYLKMLFAMMIAFYVLFNVRKLLVGVY